MPFDGTTHRGPGGGHDPVPTWGERIAAWAAAVVLAATKPLVCIALAEAAIITAVSGWLSGVLTAAFLAALFRWWRQVSALAAGRWS